MKGAWQPGPDCACDLIKWLHARWVWAACVAQQAGQTPRTAWLDAAGALGGARSWQCSAFVEGGGGLRHGCDHYLSRLSSQTVHFVATYLSRGGGQAGDTRLGSSSRRHPALACGPARVRKKEASLSCDLPAGRALSPAPRPKQIRLERLPAYISNAKTVCAKRKVRSPNTVSIPPRIAFHLYLPAPTQTIV